MKPEDIKPVLDAWRNSLTPGEAAELRRASVEDASILPQTFRLLRELRKINRAISVERAARCAVVIACVRDPKSGHFAAQMAAKKVSEIRFRRLLAEVDPTDAMRRIVKHVEACDINTIATAMIFWNHRTKTEWAETYYGSKENS